MRQIGTKIEGSGSVANSYKNAKPHNITLMPGVHKSVEWSWLAFRFFNVISFVYNPWCAYVNSIGPPTRLPQALHGSAFSLLTIDIQDSTGGLTDNRRY